MTVCAGSVHDVEVFPESASSLKVKFKVRSAVEAEQVGAKIMQLPELAPYRVNLDVQVGQ